MMLPSLPATPRKKNLVSVNITVEYYIDEMDGGLSRIIENVKNVIDDINDNGGYAKAKLSIPETELDIGDE